MLRSALWGTGSMVACGGMRCGVLAQRMAMCDAVHLRKAEISRQKPILPHSLYQECDFLVLDCDLLVLDFPLTLYQECEILVRDFALQLTLRRRRAEKRRSAVS